MSEEHNADRECDIDRAELVKKKAGNATATKTVVRASKYAIVGIVVTLFNFVAYTIIAQLIIRDNNLLWVDSIIAYIMAAILAYILHSRVTWKERKPRKWGIARFFAWNLAGALIVSPILTKIFGFWEPLYQFVYDIASAMHLPFNYDFVESTGIFCLTTLITMILNYLFYDRLVFGEGEMNKKEF